MKPKFAPFAFGTVLALSFVFLFFLSQNVAAANIISGTIYDKARNPLADIDIELLDEYQRLISRQKTTSSGRYEFVVQNSGNYYTQGLCVSV